jgi:photosystem II stability/assembly factor-like uncharacterized protein
MLQVKEHVCPLVATKQDDAIGRGSTGWGHGTHLMASRRGHRSSRTIPRGVASWSALLSVGLFLLAACGSPQTTSVGAGPKPSPTSLAAPSPSPTGVARAIDPPLTVAISGNSIWIINHPQTPDPGAILRSTDEGRSFSVVYSGPLSLAGLDFVDANDGYALAGGALLRTQDSGTTWAAVHEPTSPLQYISFATATIGYGVAANYKLFSTVDGGSTWRGVSEAPTALQQVCAPVANTPGKVWAIGDRSVYKSTDGGQTWRTAFTGNFAGDNNGGNSLRCSGEAAWAEFDLGGGVGTFHAAIARTIDGAAWSVVMPDTRPGTLLLAGPTSAHLITVCPICTGSPITDTGTDDGGTTFAGSAVAQGAPGDALGVDGAAFATPQFGAVVVEVTPFNQSASLREVLVTTNGGTSWRLVLKGPRT